MDFPIISLLIMIVLAGGMFYGQIQFKKKRAEWGKTLTILCGISIVITALYVNLCSSNLDHSTIEKEQVYLDAQAMVLANNLSQMYEGGTGKCLLIYEPVFGSTEPLEDMARRVEAFKKGFQGKITDIITVPIKTASVSQEDIMEEQLSFEITAEDFNNVIGTYPDCDVIIIMSSLPESLEELYKIGIFEMLESEEDPGAYFKNPEREYPLVGIYNGSVSRALPLFFDDLIGAMTTWKPDQRPLEEDISDDPQTAFDKRYIVLRSDNIEEMEKKYPRLFPKPPKDKE